MFLDMCLTECKGRDLHGMGLFTATTSLYAKLQALAPPVQPLLYAWIAMIARLKRLGSYSLHLSVLSTCALPVQPSLYAWIAMIARLKRLGSYHMIHTPSMLYLSVEARRAVLT